MSVWITKSFKSDSLIKKKHLVSTFSTRVKPSVIFQCLPSLKKVLARFKKILNQRWKILSGLRLNQLRIKSVVIPTESLL